jgi:hypothetical protein
MSSLCTAFICFLVVSGFKKKSMQGYGDRDLNPGKTINIV